MKLTGVCPKCESQDVYRIPNSLWNDADPRVHISWTRNDIAVTRYVCGQCGYLEEWIVSAENLMALTASVARQQTAQQTFSKPNFEEVNPSYCPACGADITPENRICPSCGINFGLPHEEL